MFETARKRATDSSIDDVIEDQDLKTKPKKDISKKVMSLIMIPVAYIGVQLADYVKSHVTKEPVGIVYAGEVEAAVKKDYVSPENKTLADKYNFRGIVMWSSKKYDRAIGYFEKGIEADPTMASNYGMIAQCYLDMGINTDKAIRLSNKSLSLTNHPGINALGYGRLARAYKKKGQCDKALDFIKRYESYFQNNKGLNDVQKQMISNIRTGCQ